MEDNPHSAYTLLYNIDSLRIESDDVPTSLRARYYLLMAVERIKKNTRVYAKKQMTWFQRDPYIKWIDIDSLTIDQQIAKVVDIIQNKIDTMS